ncbi:hypothetical protein NDA16_000069 [Ustilago loliicola]|nr:hypothetical protein NDA16_000069 [Ustilago loliicola]
MGLLRIGKRWKPEGKHVLVTGGSQGLGLALAELLAAKGAHVTICSRTESKLREAVDKVKTESDFEKGMKTDYWTCLATAHAAANAMARTGIKDGKIVMVSSILGLFGLVGYSQYAPMKYAIRGLAESLRSELILYGISVHAYFPATILSPGLEEENKTKPKITLDIEGTDEGLTPAQCAKGLLKGVERNHFFITTDLNSELFRVAALGSAPTNRGVGDRVLTLVSWIAIPIWRTFAADGAIKKHRQEHLQTLAKQSK